MAWGAAAAAGPALARTDLALFRLLVRQGAEAATALQVVEDWSAGRVRTPEARKALQASLVRVKSLASQVGSAAAGDVSLGGAGRRLAADRVEQVQGALALVAGDSPSREALVGWAESQGRRSSVALAGWLEARRGAAARLRASGAVGAYYRWLERVLPLQLEEVALSGDVRRALMRGGSATLASRGRALASRVAAVVAPASLRAAQAAAFREAESLARLAEAAELMAADPSPESSSRAARWSRELRKDSAAAEAESLKALSRALGG